MMAWGQSLNQGERWAVAGKRRGPWAPFAHCLASSVFFLSPFRSLPTVNRPQGPLVYTHQPVKQRVTGIVVDVILVFTSSSF